MACPGLDRALSRAWTIRRLRFDDGWRPDLIHILHPELGAAGLAMAEHWATPYVQTVDEFLAPGERLRLSRRWCRGLIATDRELADDLVANVGVPADFVTVILPGVAADDPAAGERSTRTGVVPVIGASAPLASASGLATFLTTAWRVLDAGVDAEFVIAGRGDDESELRRRADRLRIADRVTFVGRNVLQVDFWGVLDVFCSTSIVPTTGRDLARALAHGVPSIASDIPGSRALVVHDRSGLRVPADDSHALAIAILALLADPARAAALGREGQAVIAREFDHDREARALAATYRDLLTEAGHPRLKAS